MCSEEETKQLDVWVSVVVRNAWLNDLTFGFIVARISLAIRYMMFTKASSQVLLTFPPCVHINLVYFFNTELMKTEKVLGWNWSQCFDIFRYVKTCLQTGKPSNFWSLLCPSHLVVYLLFHKTSSISFFVSLCQGDLVCLTFEECLFLSFFDIPMTCCTLTLLYYVLSCPKDPEEVRIKTAHFILFEKGCVFGCVSSAGTAALSHCNVVSLTVSPSLPLWVCFTQHLPVNQTASSDLWHSRSLRSRHGPERRWPESNSILNVSTTKQKCHSGWQSEAIKIFLEAGWSRVKMEDSWLLS